MEQQIFDTKFKTIGLVHVDNTSQEQLNSDRYSTYIKVLYLPGGGQVKVDFTNYESNSPAIFFIGPNQVFNIIELYTQLSYFIFYNRNFYCIEIHDEEVACDGLLYNNSNNVSMTIIPDHEADFINHLFHQIQDEFALKDSSQEEMLRTYLKQLFIKSTRIWKQQHMNGALSQCDSDPESFRKFTLLVDKFYKNKHTVADYADILLVAPKTLAHRFKRSNLPQPNEIIKNRIILEAKRLLVHTEMKTKEIAYELGYDDPAYFSRLFCVKTGYSPSIFRSKYLMKSFTNHIGL